MVHIQDAEQAHAAAACLFHDNFKTQIIMEQTKKRAAASCSILILKRKLLWNKQRQMQLCRVRVLTCITLYISQQLGPIFNT